MHHQIPPKNKIFLVDLTSELYERPDQNVSIHTPHTHTCTTKYHPKIFAPPNTTKNKICLVGLTSELYERPDQCERFLLNNMFLVLFSEKCWKALKNAQCFSVKSTVYEKHSTFQWKALKSTVLFSEKCSWWKVQRFSLKSAEKHNAFQWKVQLMTSATLFTKRCNSFQQNFMRFWVITKYSSFVYNERPIRISWKPQFHENCWFSCENHWISKWKTTCFKLLWSTLWGQWYSLFKRPCSRIWKIYNVDAPSPEFFSFMYVMILTVFPYQTNTQFYYLHMLTRMLPLRHAGLTLKEMFNLFH